MKINKNTTNAMQNFAVELTSDEFNIVTVAKTISNMFACCEVSYEEIEEDEHIWVIDGVIYDNYYCHYSPATWESPAEEWVDPNDFIEDREDFRKALANNGIEALVVDVEGICDNVNNPRSRACFY